MALIKNPCPHCESSLIIRSSEQESPIVKRIYLQCKNLACGFTAQGFLSIESEISPPANPNRKINLPRVVIRKKILCDYARPDKKSYAHH